MGLRFHSNHLCISLQEGFRIDRKIGWFFTLEISKWCSAVLHNTAEWLDLLLTSDYAHYDSLSNMTAMQCLLVQPTCTCILPCFTVLLNSRILIPLLCESCRFLLDAVCSLFMLCYVWRRNTWRLCSVSRWPVIGRARTCGNRVLSTTHFCAVVSANSRQHCGWQMDKNRTCLTYDIGMSEFVHVTKLRLFIKWTDNSLLCCLRPWWIIFFFNTFLHLKNYPICLNIYAVA